MPASPSQFTKLTAAQITPATDYMVGRDPETTTGVGAGAAGRPFEITVAELAAVINGLGAAVDADFVRDTIYAALVAGSANVSIVRHADGDRIVLDAVGGVSGTVTQEQIEDAVGALVAAATAPERAQAVYADNGAAAGSLTVYPTVGVGATRPAHRQGLLFWDTTLETPTS